MKGEVGDMQTLIEALKHIKTLDGTGNEVDIINMSVGQFDLPVGLDEIINELASKKILISSAGRCYAFLGLLWTASRPVSITTVPLRV